MPGELPHPAPREQRRIEVPVNLSPRLQMATQIAAALVSAPSTNGFPAGMSREPSRIAVQALELADALIEHAGLDGQEVINPGDENAIHNARTG